MSLVNRLGLAWRLVGTNSRTKGSESKSLKSPYSARGNLLTIFLQSSYNVCPRFRKGAARETSGAGGKASAAGMPYPMNSF